MALAATECSFGWVRRMKPGSRHPILGPSFDPGPLVALRRPPGPTVLSLRPPFNTDAQSGSLPKDFSESAPSSGLMCSFLRPWRCRSCRFLCRTYCATGKNRSFKPVRPKCSAVDFRAVNAPMLYTKLAISRIPLIRQLARLFFRSCGLIRPLRRAIFEESPASR